MELSRHLVVWLVALTLVALAAPLVRAYGDLLEKRGKRRSEDVASRLASAAKAASHAGEPETRHDEGDGPT